MTAEKPSTMKVPQSKSATSSGAGSGEPNHDAMVSTIVKQLRAADLEAAISARMKEEKYRQSKEAFDEEKEELRLQLEAGELDIGQDDDDGEQYVDRYRREVAESSKRRVDSFVAKMVDKGTCFTKLCAALGVPVVGYFSKPSDLDYSDLVKLSEVSTATIGCVVYSADDKRNHVELVKQHTKTGTLNFVPHELSKESERFVCITRPQEFFNAGGRFFNTSFFASTVGQSDSMQDFPGNDNAASAFGGDTMGGTLGGHSRIPSRNDHDVQSRLFDRPPPPRSVVDESTGGGSNNITGGVSRRRNRVVKGMATYNENGFVRRNYGTSGVTMFNNVEELYLNTVSREYAQEILEELFRTWGLPTDEADAMQYAEDLVWAFLVARTASNKADYNISFEIPTRKGEVNADFSLLSRLLADKYGITRRNFARGVADDVRAYLSRSENQFVKSRSAQRVGADPQYGSLCFDGSTGCTNMTSSEATFCRLLEGRNLYERDDVIAEGASDKLMQGLHGGVRSIVPR